MEQRTSQELVSSGLRGTLPSQPISLAALRATHVLHDVNSITHYRFTCICMHTYGHPDPVKYL